MEEHSAVTVVEEHSAVTSMQEHSAVIVMEEHSAVTAMKNTENSNILLHYLAYQCRSIFSRTSRSSTFDHLDNQNRLGIHGTFLWRDTDRCRWQDIFRAYFWALQVRKHGYIILITI